MGELTLMQVNMGRFSRGALFKKWRQENERQRKEENPNVLSGFTELGIREKVEASVRIMVSINCSAVIHYLFSATMLVIENRN